MTTFFALIKFLRNFSPKLVDVCKKDINFLKIWRKNENKMWVFNSKMFIDIDKFLVSTKVKYPQLRVFYTPLQRKFEKLKITNRNLSLKFRKANILNFKKKNINFTHIIAGFISFCKTKNHVFYCCFLKFHYF